MSFYRVYDLVEQMYEPSGAEPSRGRRQTESIQLVHKHPFAFTSIKRNKVSPSSAHRPGVPTMGGLLPVPASDGFPL